MATDIKWEAPTVALTSYMTTDLDSQADGEIEVGAAINNETNLCTHMDIEITLGSKDFTTKTGGIWIYLLESVDGGTDFDTNTDNTATAGLIPPFDKVAAIMDFRAGSTGESKTVVKSMIPIPPGRFKIGVRNMSGIAFHTTGNDISYRTYNLNNV